MDSVSPETLAAFALTSLLIELTPGPNMTYLALIGIHRGYRAGYAAVAGVALGLATLGLAAALGLSAIIAASPIAYGVLRWAGVATSSTSLGKPGTIRTTHRTPHPMTAPASLCAG